MTVPVVSTINPRSGPPAGGSLVDVSGTGFTGATGVSFGAVPATAFSVFSSTRVVAEAPAGTSTVHVTVTTPGGTSSTSIADEFIYADGLFSLAEARVFSGDALSDTSVYPNALVTAKEAEIREWFEQVCGVAFTQTTVTETLDGSPSGAIYVSHKNPAKESPRRPLEVVAATIDGVALTATELAAVRASGSGRLVRSDNGTWSSTTGFQDQAVTVTYRHGWETPPALIRLAALQILVTDLPASNVPFSADSYDEGGMSFNFGRGDGFNGNWHRIPDVVKALRLYNERASVIV